MVGRGDAELRGALARVFERAETWVRCEAVEPPGDREHLRAHGYVGTQERRAIALEVIERLVRPAARALLGTPTSFVGLPTATSR
jgi:hypothetical protein